MFQWRVRMGYSDAVQTRYERPSEKSSPPGQAPQHQADHTDVDERLAGAAQQLVVLTEPAGMGLPRECPFHSPPSGQDAETGRGPIPGPADLVRRNVLGHPDIVVA